MGFESKCWRYRRATAIPFIHKRRSNWRLGLYIYCTRRYNLFIRRDHNAVPCWIPILYRDFNKRRRQNAGSFKSFNQEIRTNPGRQRKYSWNQILWGVQHLWPSTVRDFVLLYKIRFLWCILLDPIVLAIRARIHKSLSRWHHVARIGWWDHRVYPDGYHIWPVSRAVACAHGRLLAWRDFHLDAGFSANEHPYSISNKLHD